MRWAALSDALLEREARELRQRRGVPADALVGLRTTTGDVDQILAELAGGPPPKTGGTGAKGGGRKAPSSTAVDAARRDFPEALAEDPVLRSVCASAGLDDDSAEVLALLLAVDIEPRRQRLLGYLQDDVSAVHPRLHTLLRLFGPDHPGVAAVAPGGALRRSCLVELGSGPTWGATPVLVHPTLTWAIAGTPVLDPDLPPGCTFVETAAEAAWADEASDFVLVWGPDPAHRIAEATRRITRRACLVARPPEHAAAWDALVRTAVIFGLGILLEVGDPPDEQLRHRIVETPMVAFGLLSPHALPLDQLPDRPATEFEVTDPIVPVEEIVVQLGQAPPEGHHLTYDQVRQLRRVVAADPAAPLPVRRLAAGSLEQLARRITPSRSFADLVLPERIERQLRGLIDRYRTMDTVHRDWGVDHAGTAGIVALFAGESGTGKTASAEAIAHELGLDLYKVDISAVVSKWIGETEKNLEQIFRVAESAQQILVFDEADALFGKRSEVTDARDRYANLEVAYLLQRVETYRGIVILTSNIRQNLDTAFSRRLSAVVDFPVPGPAERQAIWQVALRGAPVDPDLELVDLAEAFEVTGGVIASAAVAASHLAAAEGTSVGHRHLLEAMRGEYSKMDRLLPSALAD